MPFCARPTSSRRPGTSARFAKEATRKRVVGWEVSKAGLQMPNLVDQCWEQGPADQLFTSIYSSVFVFLWVGLVPKAADPLAIHCLFVCLFVCLLACLLA